MRRWLKAWWATQVDLQILGRLEDRMLEDMGLEREGLRARVMGRPEPSAARKGGAWGPATAGWAMADRATAVEAPAAAGAGRAR